MYIFRILTPPNKSKPTTSFCNINKHSIFEKENIIFWYEFGQASQDLLTVKCRNLLKDASGIQGTTNYSNPLTPDSLIQILQTYLHVFPQFTYQTAVLLNYHTFSENTSIISPRGLKGAKKEKTYYKMYVQICTFPCTTCSISKNLIGYGIFRKHLSLSKTVREIHSNSDL